MKVHYGFIASFLFLEAARAHYLFGRLIVNNTITSTFDYVRQVGPKGGDALNLTWPLYDVDHTDIRCGRDATTGLSTKTAAVAAGSEIGFQVGDIMVSPTAPYVFHIGPGSMWLSKTTSDGDLRDYKGDGDWFKIASVTKKPGDDIHKWYLDYEKNWNVTIPATTPPGKYLLRIEHFYPRPDVRDRPDLQPHSDTQFFINCAQIEIVGKGGGVPGPLVKIPGVYKKTQKDVFFDASGMYDVSKYVAPYPPAWKG